MTKNHLLRIFYKKTGLSHHRNLRTLAIELFEVFKGLSPFIFAEAFPVRQQSQYNMRNCSYFAMPRPKTVNHGLESLSYIGVKFWDSVPSHMKEIDSINEFKHVINLETCYQLGNLICAQADFAKFTYKTLDIFSQQKKNSNNNNTYMYTKIHVCLRKSEYHNCFSRLPYVVHLLFLV